MDLQKLKQQVFKANLDLVRHGLVIFTWGNVSGIDRDQGLVVIKPSGVSYDEMKSDDMLVVDMEGNIVEGCMNPSSDTPTHLELYKSFPEIGGIAHTHSTYATAWAQAGKSIPVIGTTHADYFSEDIPCTENMSTEEIVSDYEKNTGTMIVRAFEHINSIHVPGVLVRNHGPFTWGETAEVAVYNSVVIEEVAKMAHISYSLNPKLTMNQDLVTKHFNRKHGKDSYYGQKLKK